jgi:hypothetical protein
MLDLPAQCLSIQAAAGKAFDMPAVLSSLALPIGRVAAIANGAGGRDRVTEGDWDATVLFVNGALAAVNTRAVGGADTQGNKPCLYERRAGISAVPPCCLRVFCLWQRS